MSDWGSHPALEPLPLSEGERVCLGNDRNHIDLVVDGLHELNIQGFQAGWRKEKRGLKRKKSWSNRQRPLRDSPVAKGGDEIEAAVDPIVNNVSAVKAALVVEVALKLVVDVADDGAEAGREQEQVTGVCFSRSNAPLRRTEGSNQSWLLMASPYPGVSTTVRRSFTPRSSISTVDASIWTVRSIFSVRNETNFFFFRSNSRFLV